MAGFIRAIALDVDGTITAGDRLSASALRAVEALRDDGLAALIVTGRMLDELDAAFPGLADRFDAVVAENGAVLVSGGTVRDLMLPVEDSLVRALTEADVPFRRGRVLLAADGEYAPAVLEHIGALGLDCQIVRNRAALMVLPAGVSKGTGLLVALDELGISRHNTIAVGDAENDLALLQVSEVGVAVGNAVASLRSHADLVLEEPDGRGVARLLAGPVRSGGQAIRPSRRRLTLGRFEDGTPATVPAAQANVLICGETGAGKSYVAGLLVEEWVTAGYTLLVVDMEGDHRALHRLHDTVVLDGRPSARELLSVLRQQGLSVVLDTSPLPPADRLEYLRTLPPVIAAERAAWGLPHWIVLDEAHNTLAEGGVAADVFRPSDLGYCLVTFHPEQLCSEALAAIDVTITVDPLPLAFAGGRGTGERTATVREAGAPERRFTVGHRRTPHVRHRGKYAVTPLPRHRWFGFRRPDGHVIATAGDLAEFTRLLRHVDPNVLAHHLEHGDFSRWLIGTIQDRELGALVGAMERNLLARRANDVVHARERLVDEIESRYLSGR